MQIGISDRLKKLPPYLFAEIDRLKREAVKAGKDIINLGVGDPDQPTASFIIKRLYEAAADPVNHQYALDAGLPELRQAIVKWYKQRFDVDLDPVTEVLPLIGSKEGISHMPLAFINPGEIALIPDPCYPPYRSGVIFAGGELHVMPLLEENDFVPDFKVIPPEIADNAKMMFLNYPNNPTASVASLSFFTTVVEFARQYNIIICHDAAYTELAFDGYQPPSFLQVEGAKEVGAEFHSLSKTYHMTGWRIGFAVGNAEIIRGLAQVKSNIDSGIFQAIQWAGIAALTGSQKEVALAASIYQERRDLLIDGLRGIGWDIPKPKATFYVWCPVPHGYDSKKLVMFLLQEAGIVVTPGVGFGKHGEGFVRFALTVDKNRIQEAVDRIRKIML